MASTYRTPGVYIEEIPIFPPSVAQVETAIPVFIGYTKTASYNGESLTLKPIRITSMLDFVERYGTAQSINISSVSLDALNNVTKVVSDAKYLMFDSLRLYFDNGGGDCYIVSVGAFVNGGVPAKADLEKGLSEAAKADEPTLIVFPDGVNIATKEELYDLYKLALEQCNKLQDRFLIGDVVMTAGNSTSVDFTNEIDTFRLGVGMQNLKYGAAYYPYLKVNLPREVKYRDIAGKVTKLGATVNWASFIEAGDTETTTVLSNLNNIVATLKDKMEPEMSTFLATKAALNPGVEINDLEDVYLVLKNSFLTVASNPASLLTALRAEYLKLFDYIYEIAFKFLEQYQASANIQEPVKALLKSKMDTLVAGIDVLIKIDNSSKDLVGTAADFPRFDDNAMVWNYVGPNDWKAKFVAGNKDDTLFTHQAAPTDAQKKENMANIESKITEAFYAVNNTIAAVYSESANLEKANETVLVSSIPTLQNVLGYIKKENFLLPPSSAIAGVYASVDADRGVWKAPANVSLNAVIGTPVQVTNDEQDRLNVHETGKSINVIRSFTGKGVLVWGARTLAGNDAEWRYVPVRRFFNMVEESVKKATSQFVFEPNDANTWVKVRAMIENFLILQWRAGALAGAKPNEAFFVKVGLGQTMTAQDILDGYMHIEIGMAVVRPAEFIVLKFSHKLQES